MGVVVHDDNLAEASTQTKQVFHKPPLYWTAGVSLETTLDEVVVVEHIQPWIRILAQAGCEDNHFEPLGDGLQEAVDVGALEHIHSGHPCLNFDVDDEVVAAGGPEGRVD